MQTISDLQHKLQQSRSKIADEYLSLSESLNVTKRIEYVIRKNPLSWISTFFLVGASLPWCLKKMTLRNPQKLQVLPSEEKAKNSSAFSRGLFLAVSLLQDKTVRSGLFSAVSLLTPLAYEAIARYRDRDKGKENLST